MGSIIQNLCCDFFQRFPQNAIHSLAWSDMRFDGKGFLCAGML